MKLGAVAMLSLVVLGIGGCGGATTSPNQQEAIAVSTSASLPGFAPRDPRLHVAHTGLRRLEFAPTSGRGMSFRERITTDGNGRFAIEPDSLIDAPGVDWSLFAMQSELRQGFHFRYRDFQVRDVRQFLRNWRTTDLGPAAPVAGRACERYRIVRSVGTRVSYELSVDNETGLVLASEQRNDAGDVIASMVYETFELDPPLDGVVWHQPVNAERTLTSPDALPTGRHPLRPRLIPAGYELRETSIVSAGVDSDWLKLTYTDGIQPLFFMQSVLEASAGSFSNASLPSSPGLPQASSVIAFQIGSARAIQGTVDGYDVMVVGTPSEEELLDMIESSLP